MTVKSNLCPSLSGSLLRPLQKYLAFLAFQGELNVMKKSLLTISVRSLELLFLISAMKSNKGTTFTCLLITFREAACEVFSKALGNAKRS